MAILRNKQDSHNYTIIITSFYLSDMTGEVGIIINILKIRKESLRGIRTMSEAAHTQT